MTREEAIKIFNTVLFFGKCDCSKEEVEECFKMAIKALEQEQTTKIEESNFSQEQYKADLQSAYDCGLKRLLSQDDYCLVSVASVKRALEQETRWIPVSERLPDTDDEVLCWYEYYHWSQEKVLPEYGFGSYFKETKAWFGEVAIGKDVRVIAWQPLPKPYREKESMEV